MTATRQLSLFDWGRPTPPAERASGFRIWHPCACGRTHAMLYLTEPYGMIALRHWSLSEPSRHTLEMMTERLRDWGLTP